LDSLDGLLALLDYVGLSHLVEVVLISIMVPAMLVIYFVNLCYFNLLLLGYWWLDCFGLIICLLCLFSLFCIFVMKIPSYMMVLFGWTCFAFFSVSFN
jgi:hypothetical protein